MASSEGRRAIDAQMRLRSRRGRILDCEAHGLFRSSNAIELTEKASHASSQRGAGQQSRVASTATADRFHATMIVDGGVQSLRMSANQAKAMTVFVNSTAGQAANGCADPSNGTSGSRPTVTADPSKLRIPDAKNGGTFRRIRADQSWESHQGRSCRAASSSVSAKIGGIWDRSRRLGDRLGLRRTQAGFTCSSIREDRTS